MADEWQATSPLLFAMDGEILRQDFHGLIGMENSDGV